MRRKVIPGVFVMLSCAWAWTPVRAQEQQDTASAFAQEVKLFRSSFTYGVTSPSRWTFETVRTIAGAGGFVVALSSQDDRFRDIMTRNRSAALDDVASVVQPLGMEASLPIVGVFLLTGVVLDNEKARNVGAEALASSLVAGGIVTPTLKLAFGRSRPRDREEPYTFAPFTGAESFPSGHTTQAFAIASVIASEYDATWVQVSAYGLASLVGIARMYTGAHFISDVAAGAMIGTAVGTTIARRSRHERALVQPVLTQDGGVGVMLRIVVPEKTGG
jgi:membrane-associated phospholipid phosphatase